MARPPAPPGPPPPHYRPPGSPASPPSPSWDQPWTHPIGQPAPPPVQGTGASAGAVTAVAVITLLLGLVIGFFIGRATESDGGGPLSAPPITSESTTTSRPPGDTIPANPPTDPEAPPSTDLDPSTIGSLEDPVPIGQSYVLGLYEIEVLGVERDAGELLAEHDPSNPEAPEGRQHMLVEISVRFTDGSGLGNPAAIPFFVSDGAARWNDFEASCGAVPDTIIDAGLLEEDDEATGNVCFTVPREVAGQVVFGTEGFAGPLYFALPD